MKILIDADELNRYVDNLEGALQTISDYDDNMRLIARLRSFISGAAVTSDMAGELAQLREENAEMQKELKSNAEIMEAMQRDLMSRDNPQ